MVGDIIDTTDRACMTAVGRADDATRAIDGTHSARKFDPDGTGSRSAKYQYIPTPYHLPNCYHTQ